jgi:hypothetical protein
VTLVSDHRRVAERTSSGEFVRALAIFVVLASCLLQESGLFEEVFVTYDAEICLCYSGASYRFGVFERVLVLVIDLCLHETSQSWAVSVGEPLPAGRIHRHPSS